MVARVGPLHPSTLRARASEARRAEARLEQLARAARDRGGDHACRDMRAVEQRLVEAAAIIEGLAQQIEAAARP
jgi:hypothetical protein